MAITKVTDPSAVPAAVADYTAQNTHLDRLLGDAAQPYPVSGSNVLKGSKFNIGGDMFYTGADTAISGTPSDYVKLTVSGTTATPSFVASLSGVAWNQAYNGYYSGSDLYLFDEAKAVLIGAIAGYKTRLGKLFELVHTGGISMKGATNVDRNIEFASDADLLWDEANDRFNFNKQVRGNATGNIGIYGCATCCGIYGLATGNIGIFGCATNFGVYGCATGNIGIYGQAICCGIFGCATGNIGIYGQAICCGIFGFATGNIGIYGCAICCGIFGFATGNIGIYGCATNFGVYGCATGNIGIYGQANGNCGVYGCAVCYGVYGCATSNCGVYGRAGSNYGVYGYAGNRGVYGCATDFGVYGCATCYGVYGVITTAYPVAGNGAYYNASTKYLKQPSENICLSKCLLEKPLPIYKWRWEDENQRGFDEFIAPYAEDLKDTFNLTERDNGYYTMDGIALGLGIELLKEIQFLKKRIKTLEEKVNGN